MKEFDEVIIRVYGDISNPDVRKTAKFMEYMTEVPSEVGGNTRFFFEQYGHDVEFEYEDVSTKDPIVALLILAGPKTYELASYVVGYNPEHLEYLIDDAEGLLDEYDYLEEVLEEEVTPLEEDKDKELTRIITKYIHKVEDAGADGQIIADLLNEIYALGGSDRKVSYTPRRKKAKETSERKAPELSKGDSPVLYEEYEELLWRVTSLEKFVNKLDTTGKEKPSKTVSRTDFDDLKRRLVSLEEFVNYLDLSDLYEED